MKTMSREEWHRILDLSKKIEKETGYPLIDNNAYGMFMRAQRERIESEKAAAKSTTEEKSTPATTTTTPTTPESVISPAPASVEGTDTK